MRLKVSATITLIIAMMTPIVFAYGVPEGQTELILTHEHWDRLISIDEFDYTFRCPEFSELDEFTIDMSVPQLSKEYFDNYERILCSDMSPIEIMQGIEEKMNKAFDSLKEQQEK